MISTIHLTIFITYLSLSFGFPVRRQDTITLPTPSGNEFTIGFTTALPTPLSGTVLAPSPTTVEANVTLPIASSNNDTNTAEPIPLWQIQEIPNPSTSTLLNTSTSIPTSTFSTSSSALPSPSSIFDNALLASLRRSAEFTSAAYCSSDSVANWECGVTCQALGNITVLTTGGDNGLIPDYYIAYDPSTQFLIVSQQGTDPRSLLSLSVDAAFLQSPLNNTYFPSAPNGTMIHTGFQDAFLRTVSNITEGVLQGVEQYNVTSVLVTGHSLGAAIGVMNGVYLTGLFERLGREVNVTTHVFGLPRAGNGLWADFVDSMVGGKLLHMHLAHDPIPTIPPRHILDYTHPSGEVFDPLSVNSTTTTTTTTGGGGVIGNGSGAVFCPGRENENCSAGNEVFMDSIEDHLGPYLSVEIASWACPN